MQESTEKTTSARNRILSFETDELEPWATSPFRLLSTGPCLHCVTVHCLASSQRSVTSPRKGMTFVSSDENGSCRPRLAPQCLHSLLEIEKEIVREVARGDKPYMRKSTDRKAQIRKAFVQLSGLICALRSVDFLM